MMKFSSTRISLVSLAVFGVGFFVVPLFVSAAFGDTTTFVGKIYDGDGGLAKEAFFDFPEDIAIDSAGNFYVADTFNFAIRKIEAGTTTVSTVAGNGSEGDQDGPATSSELDFPRGVTVDPSGTSIYISDSGNNKVKKVTAGVVSTLVASGLSNPQGLVLSPDGATLYFADSGNNAIKSVPVAGGTVTTVASSGLSDPKRLAISADGTTLYVADNGSHRILAVAVSSGAVSVIAGSGSDAYVEGTSNGASFESVWGIARTGNTLVVSDHDFSTIDRIRRIDLTTGTTTLVFQDIYQQELIFPSGLVVKGNDVYVVTAGLGTIHRFNINNGTDNSLFGGKDRFGNRTGAVSTALLGRPSSIFLTPDRKWIYVSMNNLLRKINRETGEVVHVIGSMVDNYRGEGTDLDTLAVRFSTIQGIAVNQAQTKVYVVDRWNNRIRGVDLTASSPKSFLVTGAGLINTNASSDNGYQEGKKCSSDVRTTGVAGCAYFRSPIGLALSPDETTLYVADTGNNRIRSVRISDGQTTLIAGTGQAGFVDGGGTAAKFNRPVGLAINPIGTILYVADTNNHRIRQIDLSNNSVSTLIGNGTAGYREAIATNAILSFPENLTMGGDGNLYFSEVGSHRVRLVNPVTKLTKLVAGSGTRGFKDGAKDVARFNNLKGLAVDVVGSSVYVSDSWNDMVRKIDITGEAPYANPAPTPKKVIPSPVNPAWDKGSGLQVKIEGLNFFHGAKTYFGDIPAEKTYVQSKTSVAVRLPLSKLKPGVYDVTIISLDGQTRTFERALVITDAAGNPSKTYFPYSKKTKDTIVVTGDALVITGRTFTAFTSRYVGAIQVAVGELNGVAKEEIVVGTGPGQIPEIRVFNNEGTRLARFFPYGQSTKKAGVRVATCDVNSDGVEEIVTVPGPGLRPTVKMLSMSGQTVLPSFVAQPKTSIVGSWIACGDFNGDGSAEIIVSPGIKGAPTAFVYRPNGTLIAKASPFGSKFLNGMTLSIVPVTGAATRLALGPEEGTGPVKLYTLTGTSLTRVHPGFFPFGKVYRGGVSLGAGDVDADGKAEIIAGSGSQGSPTVRLLTSGGIRKKAFLSFSSAATRGVNVAAGDVDGDGKDEVIVVGRSATGSTVKIVDADRL